MKNIFAWSIIMGIIFLLVVIPVDAYKANAPQLISPKHDYSYKICDSITLQWLLGTGTEKGVYLNMLHDGEPFMTNIFLPKEKTSLFLPSSFLEIQPDGEYKWYVCNYPDNVECSSQWKITKQTKPTLLTPENFAVVGPTTKFTWTKVDGAKNYIAFVGGAFAIVPGMMYIPMGDKQSFQMTPFIYNKILMQGTFLWQIAAVCNENPTQKQMKKYTYTDFWYFIKL
ncbi:MAG: hypothetical protein ABIF08_03250 [Nanoarchaeota archaeon]